MQRYTQLSNGFSRKIENHAAAIALYLMYCNFGRIHQTLRVTPRWKRVSAIMCGALRKSSSCSGELQLADDFVYWDQAVVTHHVVASATLSDHEVVTLRNELIPRFNHGLQ